MRIDKDECVEIKDSDIVKVKKMGNVIEVCKSNYISTDMPIKKLDSNRYMVKTTGEIKEFCKTKSRAENLDSIRNSFKKLRDLINANFVGGKNELFITLTYAENMTDPKKLYSDFEKFNKKMKYRFKDVDIDYINVVEPQERGAWHCHILYRFNGLETIYIKNKDIADLWGHGFVVVKGIEGCDNIGAYLSAYLGDIELDSDSAIDFIGNTDLDIEIVSKNVDGIEKKFIKGGRLHMYEKGMRIYRKSKGILVPIVEDMVFSDIKKIVGTRDPHYSRNIEIFDNDNKLINRHQYIQYNVKR